MVLWQAPPMRETGRDLPESMAPGNLQDLSAREERALRRAVAILEGKSFVGRLTDLTGEPVSQMLRRLPAPINNQINRIVRRTLFQALDVALYKLGSSGLPEPPPALFQFASGTRNTSMFRLHPLPLPRWMKPWKCSIMRPSFCRPTRIRRRCFSTC